MKTEKFYLASTGREVKYGDVLKGHHHKPGMTSTTVITVNDYTIPMLKAAGIIVESPPDNSSTIPSKVLDRIAIRTNSNPKKVKNILNYTAEIMPMAAVNIVLREIACILDEKYPDHINKSDKIYVISTLDGRIHEVSKAHIKNYRNFAAFRTIEDAKVACNIVRDQLKDMFKSGK